RLREIAPALPVIGLTAHAFAEEREKCLAAGMAEHVTKPIDPDLLVAAILRQTRPAGPIPSPALPFAGPRSGIDGPRRGIPVTQSEGMQSTPAPTFTTLIDWQALLAQYSGREAFVAKLASLALTGQQETPAKLRAAAGQGDWQALAFVAHSLKGVGGNLMAPGVQDLAARTERAAKSAQPEAAELATELAAELADQVEALLAELGARIRENGGPSSA
ncbi:MAG: Hpt domain-containing protein, partial [Sulfuritalea sp.]|nr:Hpt domain-containing protein [Sulfuritalea sp.]